MRFFICALLLPFITGFTIGSIFGHSASTLIIATISGFSVSLISSFIYDLIEGK